MKPLDFDVECTGCRYNLRGRPALGRCPECGTFIGETIRAISARETGQTRWSRRWFAVSPALSAIVGAVVSVLLFGAMAAHAGWLEIGPHLALDLISTLIIGGFIMAILRAPRSWLLPTLIEVFAALGLGTGLFLLAGSQGIGVLALYGVTIVGIAVFTRIDPSDGVWFLLVIAALRLPHLL